MKHKIQDVLERTKGDLQEGIRQWFRSKSSGSDTDKASIVSVAKELLARKGVYYTLDDLEKINEFIRIDNPTMDEDGAALCQRLADQNQCRIRSIRGDQP